MRQEPQKIRTFQIYNKESAIAVLKGNALIKKFLKED